MTERFTGTCEWLADVAAQPVIDWITAIDFADWPQQHRIDHQLRPAMVSDFAWHEFGAASHGLIAHLAGQFGWGQTRQRMLSVVMPGHSIPPHTDEQGPEWKYRVHVPLTTNDQSQFIVGGVAHHMKIGSAYRVNTLAEHSVTNDGQTPRIHFMFDVVG